MSDNYYKLELELEECSICLEEMKDYKNIIILDCRHVFHTKCILKWSKSNNNISYLSDRIRIKSDCPLCKKNYIKDLRVIKKTKCCSIL